MLCSIVANFGTHSLVGVDNLPSPVGIGLTDLTNILGPVAPLAPPVPASLYPTLHHNSGEGLSNFAIIFDDTVHNSYTLLL